MRVIDEARNVCQALSDGIYMVSGSSLTLNNVDVTDNEAANWGGGIFAWESAVTIEGRANQILP